MHVIAAKAVAFMLAATDEFRDNGLQKPSDRRNLLSANEPLCFSAGTYFHGSGP